jgi:Ser/Thr protein kinase RdoA (MazF antagonist)
MHSPVPSLSHHGQVRRLTSLARTTLQAYPLPETRLRLIAHLWNTTFRVLTPGGDQYMLRVHHPGQTSVDAVRSELLWLVALREDTGLPVPQPVRNRAQEWVTIAAHPEITQPRLCVLFRWVEGRFLYRGLTPAHLFQVGRLMARLQEHAAAWTPPAGFTRHRVDNLDPMRRDRDDRFAEEVATNVVQSVAAVSTPEAAEVVAAAVHKVWVVMRALGESPDQFGLIHADLHQRNVLFHHGAAGAIDFDDCGFGHWLYDLAVPLTGLQYHPRYPALRSALLAGYFQSRPRSPQDQTQLETFIALRRIQDLVGVMEERENPAFRDTWQTAMENELQELRAFVER